jgi:hypothetical protein
MTDLKTDDASPLRLRCTIVLKVSEDACEVRSDGKSVSVVFAPQFPQPRIERVSPGHLVALATAPDGRDFVVWRWYDAVVVGEAADDSIWLWEPAHGEVIARLRKPQMEYPLGTRAYLSAGLPGSDWWAAGPVVARAEDADVDVDEVERLYTENALWGAAFAR